jgi:predicted DNA-binding transcriptional regulator YafY
MNRIDRLVAIQTFMQSRRLLTANDIAERFDISLRTVYRDIRALEESGVPIVGEAGVGYSIEAGFRLPPVMFSREEATAMITAGKIMGKLTDPSVDTHFSTALEKVRAVIRHSDKEFVESMEDNIVVMHFPTSNSTQFPNRFMFPVQEALSGRRVIKLVYESGGKGEVTAREVEPAGMCFYGGRWHLLAFCTLRGNYRDFRLDRIRQLSVLQNTFQRQHPPVEELMSRMFDNTGQLTATLRFSPAMHDELAIQKYYYGFVKETISDEGVLMTFVVNSLDWIARWVLTMGGKVTVVDPPELRQEVQSRIKELARNHCS